MTLYESARKKLFDAYFPPGKAEIDPGVLALLSMLVQTLLASCNPDAALAFARNAPLMAAIRVRWHVRIYSFASGEQLDVSRLTNAIILAGQTVTVEELTAFLTAAKAAA